MFFRFCVIGLLTNLFAGWALAAQTPFSVKKVATSRSHTCALAGDGRIKCWGSNEAGQLGIGSRESHGNAPNTMGADLPFVDLGKDFRAKDICVSNVSGVEHGYSCVVNQTGKIKCWGRNNYGILGQGRPDEFVGIEPSELGDNLPFTDLGDNFVAQNVTCGAWNACALGVDGKVKCWGWNVASGSNYSKEKMGNALPYLPLPEPVQSVSLGYLNDCAVSKTSTYCWNSQYAANPDYDIYKLVIKDVPLEARGKNVSIEKLTVGSAFGCAKYRIEDSEILKSSHKVKCWGLNLDGNLAIGSKNDHKIDDRDSLGDALPPANLGVNEISEISAGAGYACMVSRGKVKCWGRNFYGQLGYGDRQDRGGRSEDLGANLGFIDLGLPAIDVAVGSESSCAVLINHEVKCWGSGDGGVSGYEDEIVRGGNPETMGDHLPFVRIQ